MFLFFEKLISLCRDCPLCGHSSGGGEVLCDPCLESFIENLKSRGPLPRLENDWPHYWLKTWRLNDNELSRLVYGLKGGGLGQTFDLLAQLFLTYRLRCLPAKGRIYYPSRGKKDHAYEWARALGGITGFERRPLVLNADGKQALKSKWHRRQRRFSPDRSSGATAVFADDVLTTGSTAQAAYKALGWPKNFTVWTIFYRPRL